MNGELLRSDKKQNLRWKEYLKMAATWAFMGASACVWWFLLYPELCFPEDTYDIVYEIQEEEEGREKEDIYNMLMYSDDGKLVIKSKILEWLKSQ